MKPVHKLFISFVLVLLTNSSQAQSLTSKGTIELGGEFSFSSQTISQSTTSSYNPYNTNRESYDVLLFSPYVGVMMGQGFELGFMPAIANSGSVTSLNLFLAPAYNISTSGNAVPYFEGLIGYSTINNGRSAGGLGIGVSGGVKVTIGSSGLFLFSIKYLHQSFEEERDYYSFNPYYTSGTYKSTVIYNTIFAGIGFRIFIASKSLKGK